VFLYGCWYVQLVGVCSDGVDHTVRSMVLVFQLPTWVCSSPVTAVHPHEVTDSEGWCVSPVGICPLRLS